MLRLFDFMNFIVKMLYLLIKKTQYIILKHNLLGTERSNGKIQSIKS